MESGDAFGTVGVPVTGVSEFFEVGYFWEDPISDTDTLRLDPAMDPVKLTGFNRFKGAFEPNIRLFPVDLTSPSGRGIWFKLTNWQASGEGFVDPDSNRRGRVTEDFKIAPFFDHVKANEGGY